MGHGRIHHIFADNTSEKSAATELRRKRFRVFKEMLESIERPVRILDVGGSQKYWEMIGFLPNATCQITLLNIEREGIDLPYFASVQGDARHMTMFDDGGFDVVFSNSVIEHVGSFDDQRHMAAEIRRVGKRYYVQTPNRHFPIEPHFVFPFFQYLPVPLRIWLVQHFSLGWFPKIPNYALAKREVTGIRLLNKAEVVSVFPEAELYEEKYLCFTKSFVAYKSIP